VASRSFAGKVNAPEFPPGLQWVNTDRPLTLKELRGKVVVLEFWTTWCAPCVAAIPHLNELATKFEGRVQFISISNEDEEVVREFLGDKPIAGWVGLDTDRSMWKGFAVEGIPHTVLVGPEGNVLAETRPEGFTEEMLEAVVAGKIAEVREKLPKASGAIDAFAGMRSGESSEALLEAWIRPHQPSNMMGVKRANNEILMRGMGLREIIGNGLGISFERVMLPEELAQQDYDLVVRVPDARAEMLKTVLRQTLEVGLGLQLRQETREAEVWVLAAPQGRTAALRQPTTKGGSAARRMRGMLEGRYSSTVDLARMLESALGKPVVDETGIEGTFHFDLKWDEEKTESVVVAVREQLGLELREARRPIEFMVVELEERPKAGE